MLFDKSLDLVANTPRQNGSIWPYLALAPLMPKLPAARRRWLTTGFALLTELFGRVIESMRLCLLAAARDFFHAQFSG